MIRFEIIKVGRYYNISLHFQLGIDVQLRYKHHAIKYYIVFNNPLL